MKFQLYFIRKIKLLIFTLKVHKFLYFLFKPFHFFSLSLKLSKWIDEEGKCDYNDYPTTKFIPEARIEFYKYINSKYIDNKPIQYLEFGVYKGDSIKWWASNNNADSTFDGFDTFEGLPENWNLYNKGDMTTHGEFPKIRDNRVKFHKGLFQDTLPTFLHSFERKNKLVINLDADLYSSTLYTLSSLHLFLRSGDIIIFDEFNVPEDEFRAFLNYTQSFYIKLKLIAAANNYYHSAFVVE